MFDWLTFDALKGAMGNWLSILAIPIAFIVALLVLQWLIGYVVDLFRQRHDHGQIPPQQ